MRHEDDRGAAQGGSSEIELAQIQLERERVALERERLSVEKERLRHYYAVIGMLVKSLWIVSSAVPILAMYRIARVVAGKETSIAISVSVGLSILMSVTIGGSLITLTWKGKKAAKELRRQRKQIAELERRLEIQGE
jgi:hypothetical protein